MAIKKVLDARVAGTHLESPRHPRVKPLTVKSILQKRPAELHIRADATSLEALNFMAEHDIEAVLVEQGGSFIGVFSESDYARSVLRATKLTATASVREVMTSCHVFAAVTNTVQECLSLMTENHLRYLPVQEGGNLIAIVSLSNCLIEMVAYLERVIKESELDQQVASLRGTYSC